MAGAVTVRELRQNLSVYLRRVEGGETLSVTNRGRAVAILGPIGGRANAIDRMLLERGATLPTTTLRDLPPPPKPRAGDRSLSELLEEDRQDRLG